MLYRILLLLLLTFYSNAMNIQKVDNNTFRVSDGNGQNTDINIVSRSSANDEENPIEIHIHEAPRVNFANRRYVVWVSVAGSITVSIITAIVNLVTHFN